MSYLDMKLFVLWLQVIGTNNICCIKDVTFTWDFLSNFAKIPALLKYFSKMLVFTKRFKAFSNDISLTQELLW